ncbi:hypothetical protein [Hydrogenovibrio thermophilus]|uniref:Uncharacterized protein n=1 Tax=Hydrogenovibrio thermophilus TaxID=265883 RepID=A0A451G4N7_9GAMM|nr:hypothetical protein [Hydrogenovibrio thermophilus]QAB14443.1 hypothetical protein EPV75_01530 [Hydrogenovibrio thermophilus]
MIDSSVPKNALNADITRKYEKAFHHLSVRNAFCKINHVLGVKKQTIYQANLLCMVQYANPARSTFENTNSATHVLSLNTMSPTVESMERRLVNYAVVATTKSHIALATSATKNVTLFIMTLTNELTASNALKLKIDNVLTAKKTFRPA